MKVLHLISPTGYYGAERWIVALCKNSDPSVSSYALAVTSELEDENIELLERFRAFGGRSHRLEMRSKFDISVVSQLCDLIGSNGYQVVHSHGYKSDLIALAVRWRLRRLKIVSTPHGFGAPQNIKMALFYRLGLYALRKFDKVVPLSPELAKEIERNGVPRSKISMIPNGVDLTEIDSKNILEGSVEKSETLGYVGRLSSGKQVDHVIKIFDGVWKKRNSLKLVIAGEGPERASLEKLALSLPSASSITFLGYVENRFDLMRNIDIFLMCSVSEGTPRCLMEALAIGVTVVAYDVQGVDQLITQEHTGLTSNLNDIDGMISNCKRVYKDPKLVLSMRQNGQSLISTQFSGKRLAADYGKLYEELLR